MKFGDAGIGVISGLASGLQNGALNAMIADMSDPENAARDMNLLFVRLNGPASIFAYTSGSA